MAGAFNDQKLSKAVRFGCGGLMGLVFGFFMALRWIGRTDSHLTWLVVPVAVVVGGVTAVAMRERW